MVTRPACIARESTAVTSQSTCGAREASRRESRCRYSRSDVSGGIPDSRRTRISPTPAISSPAIVPSTPRLASAPGSRGTLSPQTPAARTTARSPSVVVAAASTAAAARMVSTRRGYARQTVRPSPPHFNWDQKKTKRPATAGRLVNGQSCRNYRRLLLPPDSDESPYPVPRSRPICSSERGLLPVVPDERSGFPDVPPKLPLSLLLEPLRPLSLVLSSPMISSVWLRSRCDPLRPLWLPRLLDERSLGERSRDEPLIPL